MTSINDLKDFAEKQGIKLLDQADIIRKAQKALADKYHFSPTQIKEHFDQLIEESEKVAYEIYKQYEKTYGEDVIIAMTQHLIDTKEISRLEDLPTVMKKYYKVLDDFYLSLANSRKSRAGKTFEKIHNGLFKILKYPFEEQVKIDGKPDFLMPSAEHYKKDAPDCIIFTAKRTLRERWRQIVTEGTRGNRFFLATIDEDLSEAQLKEMHDHRISIVCPESIKNSKYPDAVNVLSFKQFFNDHLDPAMERWKRNHVIK
jgi:hypothetical protein